MSKAKDNFYRIKSICSMNVINYVDELESAIVELIADLEFISEQEDVQYIKDILNKYRDE